MYTTAKYQAIRKLAEIKAREKEINFKQIVLWSSQSEKMTKEEAMKALEADEWKPPN